MKFGKIKKTAILVAIFYIIIFIVAPLWIKVTFTVVVAAGICCIVAFIVLNKLVRQTNWWKNIFVFTNQFYNHWTYRDTPVRNLQIANVGSNPARFAFHYDDILGENWSTGTQGLDMDLQVLRHHHSMLRKGAIVLLPIVQFSSVSGYLEKNAKSMYYLTKYTRVLNHLQIDQISYFKKAKRFIKYPLFYNWKAVRYIIKDVQPDIRLSIVENPMQLNEMKKDANNWINIWKKEFDISDLHASLYPDLQRGRDRSIEMMSEMVSFLLERGYHPVLVSTPMSTALAEHFTSDIKETYIYSFVRSIQEKYDIPYLDYTNDMELTSHDLYFNALFMNLKGRKIFTKKVLKDLKLV